MKLLNSSKLEQAGENRMSPSKFEYKSLNLFRASLRQDEVCIIPGACISFLFSLPRYQMQIYIETFASMGLIAYNFHFCFVLPEKECFYCPGLLEQI